MLSGTIYYMDISEKRREEVISFLKEHDKNFIQIGNIYHAEKLFIVYSVYNWVCEQQEAEKMDKETVQFHLDLINKFIQNKVNLSWNEDGTLNIET